MLRQLGLLMSILALISPNFVMAETKLSYPELEVTPRASERLRIEADLENKGRFLNYWPIQLSALATILASNQAEADIDETQAVKDDYADRKGRSLLLGAAWILFAGGMSAAYRPYRDGYKQIDKLSNGSMREQLVRERLAEEELYRPSSTASVINWMSALTNFYAGAIFWSGGSSQARGAAGISMAMSFLPLLLDNKWEAVEKSHKEYKKKIYGPVSSGPIIMPVDEKHFAYGTGIRWSF